MTAELTGEELRRLLELEPDATSGTFAQKLPTFTITSCRHR
jgi:hypothetical protein